MAAGVLAAAFSAQATPLTAQQQSDIDASIGEWLAQTGAPSVSIAVVNGGEIAYVKAYGFARLAPKEAATPQTRYAIDSISKEFTAAAMLKLQEQGKLSLDDKVGKYFPELASADQVTIRQILSHTAGYRDYWPQDYVTREMGAPTTTRALLDEWAKKPLDFAPGADWQYSNTGFVIAGAIVEKVAGQPLVSFLKANVFEPLRMDGVIDADQGRADAQAYTRWAAGPVRVAQKEAPGWLYAAGELAMAPRELAKWDISLMGRSLLKPASYDAFYTPIKLTSGRDTHYSAGLGVRGEGEGLTLSHGGGGSGFLSSNTMWPAQKVAIAAFTNSDWATPEDVAARVAFVVVKPTAEEARARAVFRDFEEGRIDRSRFTDNGNAYLTSEVLADQKAGLAAFGPARTFQLRGEQTRGGLKTRNWRIMTAKGALNVVERAYPDGKIEQFTISKGD
jgi:CubicO group peptidase (beta-lactamase class C family)